MYLGDNEAEDRNMDDSCVPENIVDSVGCFGDTDFNSLSAEDMRKFKFAYLEVAYDFYNEYGKFRGFSNRRSKVGRNGMENIVWQTFLCSRDGER